MTNRPTVLIVDDSPMMCRFLGLFLEKKFDVISYTNSIEAVTLIQEGFSPDMIVTDLNMPEMNGIELLRIVKSFLPNIPVLVVSGSKESKDRINTFEAGADDFLMKPFHPAELYVRVGKLIDNKDMPVKKPNRAKQLISELMKSASFF